MTAQVPGHAAAAVRRAQRHDAPRFLLRMVMQQRANQNTAHAMSHEVHGIGIECCEKTRKPVGIRAQIGTNRRIGKHMNGKTLALQAAREHEQNVAREPQAVEDNDGLGPGVRYGETSI